ncbi:MAG: hypothetical protein ACFCU6_10875 [Balneolaceae bacterium]
MTRLTIYTGVGLIITGTGYYFITGMINATSLLSVITGTAFAGLGILGQKIESMRKHFIYAALLLAILTLFSTISGFVSLFRLVQGIPVERSSASIAQGTMFIICFLFVYFILRSLFREQRSV